ncbi:MAG: phosphate propanoyltransferase [Coriobacteriia bacterium]|nr:phosphate propanoyltransferase [Coriobacteriia bacterium]
MYTTNLANKIQVEMIKQGYVEIEASARHVHLCKDDLMTLFGMTDLEEVRELSQPGQYLSGQKLILQGPKRKIERVSVLGPLREKTQVEISKSDAIQLGVDCPIRESGDIKDSGKITLIGPKGQIELGEGVIIAHNHIHVTPYEAKLLNLKDKEIVSVKVMSVRPVTFDDVVVRIDYNFAFRMHVDFDEANAAAVQGFTLGKIIKRN